MEMANRIEAQNETFKKNKMDATKQDVSVRSKNIPGAVAM